MTEITRLYDGTEQGLFDTVTRHLFTQGRPALSGSTSPRSSNGCMYRGEHGTKCAAGVLIPDEKYTPDMEDRPAGAAIVRNAIGIRSNSIQEALVSRLQRTHDDEGMRNFDGLFNRPRLAAALRAVASEFGLNADAIPAT